MRRLTKRERILARRRPVTLWLDRDVLAALKATGKGWQTRLCATGCARTRLRRRAPARGRHLRPGLAFGHATPSRRTFTA